MLATRFLPTREYRNIDLMQREIATAVQAAASVAVTPPPSSGRTSSGAKATRCVIL